jgi:hypothetical protein
LRRREFEPRINIHDHNFKRIDVANSDPDSDSNAYADSNSDPNAYAHSDSNADSDSNSDTNADAGHPDDYADG